MQHNVKVNLYYGNNFKTRIIRVPSILYYLINSFAFRINHWIEAKKPRVYQETGIKLLHTDSPSVDTVKLLFEAKGNILFPKNTFLTNLKWRYILNSIDEIDLFSN